MTEPLQEGQHVRVTYDAVITDVLAKPGDVDPDGWLTMQLDDGGTVEAPYTAARAITEAEPGERSILTADVEAVLRKIAALPSGHGRGGSPSAKVLLSEIDRLRDALNFERAGLEQSVATLDAARAERDALRDLSERASTLIMAMSKIPQRDDWLKDADVLLAYTDAPPNSGGEAT